MNMKPRTWALISILCFIGAAVFWRLGERQSSLSTPPPPTNAPAPQSSVGTPAPLPHLPPPQVTLASPPPPPTVVSAPAPAAPEPFPYRLRNTPETIEQLIRNAHAVLLRNALLDTGVAGLPEIPAQLRSQGDPGTRIVQSREPLTDAYRRQVLEAGGAIVAYIPNNAWLVRADDAGARRLAALPQTQSVLPYEPYYKLEPELLALAVEQKPLWDGTRLNVLVFPEARAAAGQALAQMGATVLGEEANPFGSVLVVEPPADSLAALAQLPAVQTLEISRVRASANDMSRQRVGIATNTITAANHLGLTGANVTVAVVEDGIWGGHPDLAGSVIGLATNDTSGHGTHVAGIIVSSGQHPPTGATKFGSVPGASFRGMAPGATVLGVSRGLGDAALQQAVALSNAPICNNSWSYGGGGYDTHAASFDAAVRDSVPGLTGPQPVCYVFSAGNSGGGSASGFGGQADSIESPGTAKNVITVGATELPRFITNVVHPDCVKTNLLQFPWLSETDSSNQVAGFSSRGNVAPGIEGIFGRLKPDVVAPGVMVVSCAIPNFPYPSNFTQVRVGDFPNRTVAVNEVTLYSLYVPPNAALVTIQINTNRFSPIPWTPLPITTHFNAVPGPGDPVSLDLVTLIPATNGVLYYSISNPTGGTVTFDVHTEVTLTNCPGDYYTTLQSLNDTLDPNHNYRFEQGTSQSAAVVSGLLALMRERLMTLGLTNPSPALMKALLINGAQSLGVLYNVGTRQPVTHQGWGIASLTNSVPINMTLTAGPVRFFDQTPTNALATGDTHLRTVVPSATAQLYPLRLTLVWSDPPGNPAASVKLVNDLDLIVTNLDTGEVFVGNNFGDGSDYTQALATNSTNNAFFDLRDSVNNVENVYLKPPLSQSGYAVAVQGRRVNVNAVHERDDGTLQDYVLVVSTGNPLLPTPFTVTDPIQMTFQLQPPVAAFTSNSMPMLFRRVGATPPLLVYTNGMTNQWNFFIFTNTTGFSNVAILTFMPPNLSLARNYEADLDLYVSTDPTGIAITNLDATILADAQSSVGRLGSELIVYSNSSAGAIYYIGVKSEDQMAAEYAIVALASQGPFSGRDASNNVIITFTPLPADIPDGSPSQPGGTNLIGICLEQVTIQRLIVTNAIVHEEMGDLIGSLAHQDAGQGGAATGTAGSLPQDVVLNNHRTWDAPAALWIYDDSNYEDIVTPSNPYGIPTDGPGSLNNFIGQQAGGVWTFTIVDDALLHVGWVSNLVVTIEPQSTNQNAVALRWNNIQPGTLRFTVVQVPVDATNMEICVDTQAQPAELLVRHSGQITTTNSADLRVVFPPPGGCTNLNYYTQPPLLPGPYYIAVYNPNPVAIDVGLTVRIDRDIRPAATLAYDSGTNVTTVLDDAVTNASIQVPVHGLLADVRAGVRIAHPRASDLVLHLISPNGTRVLLAENRGRDSVLGYGVDNTNFGWSSSAYTMPVDTFSGVHLLNESFETAATNSYTTNPPFNSFFPSDQAAQFGDWGVLADAVDVARVLPAFDGLNYLQLSTNGWAELDLTGAANAGWYRVSYAMTTPLDVGRTGSQIGFVLMQSSAATTNYVTNVVANFQANPGNSSNPPAFQWLPAQMVCQLTGAVQAVQLGGTNVGTNAICYDSFQIDPLNHLFDESFEGLTNRVYLAGETLAFQNQRTNTWTVDSGEVKLVARGTNNQFMGRAHTGFQALDVNGNTLGGAISTPVPTLPGHFYQVSFTTAKSPNCQGTVTAEARLLDATNAVYYRLGLTNSTAYYEVPPKLNSLTNPIVWQTNWFVFLAANTNVLLQLASTTNNSGYGMWFDTIQMVEITDPAMLEFLQTYLRPYRYAYFGEGADYATRPMKFAFPPFCSTNNQAEVMTSLFAVATNPYPIGSLVDGWTVVSNAVSVWTTNNAYRPTNVLSLANGGIERTLPTVAGRLYRLTYAYRAPETWTNNRIQNPSFELPGIDPIYDYAAPASWAGGWTVGANQVRVSSMWAPAANNAYSLDLNGVSTNSVGLGSIFQNLTNLTVGLHRLSFAYTAVPTNVPPVNKIFDVYWNSNRIGTVWINSFAQTSLTWQYTNFVVMANPAFAVGGVTNVNQLAFVSQVPGDAGPMLDDISLLEPDRRGTGQMQLSGVTNLLLTPPSDTWKTDTLLFLAPTNGTDLQFAGLNPGLELGAVLLLEIGDYNLPEEPMKPFFGLDAFGTWQLEIWDNRLSGVVSNGTLLSWELLMSYARTNIPTILAANQIPTNVIASAGSFAYFLVTLPCTNSTAVNALLSVDSPVDVWLNNRMPPTGTQPDDILLASGSGANTFTFQAGVPPLTGQNYYLGVYNPSGNTNGISFQATWDNPCQPTGQSASWVLSPSGSGFTPSGFKLAWSGPPGQHFTVEYSTAFPPVWQSVPGGVTSPTGDYSFTDDGTLTGGLSTNRFYRIKVQ